MTNRYDALKNRIMRKIYAIWFLKSVAPFLVVESAAFFGFIYALSRLTYVRAVLDNTIAAFFADPIYWIIYEISAFVYWKPVTQSLILASVAMIFFAGKNLFRAAVEFKVIQSETG